jgi:hypothetical protein
VGNRLEAEYVGKTRDELTGEEEAEASAEAPPEAVQLPAEEEPPEATQLPS